MTEEQILKSFNNRWRIKSADFMSLDVTQFQRIKELCLDFFRTGITLAEYPEVGDLVNEKPSTILMSGITKAAEEVAFSTWWDLYGKKIDRAKCEKKWNKLTVAEKQACLAATPAYVASTPDLQYRRHPATYLNNKSWENQIIPYNNATNKPSIQQQRLDKLASILTE